MSRSNLLSPPTHLLSLLLVACLAPRCPSADVPATIAPATAPATKLVSDRDEFNRLVEAYDRAVVEPTVLRWLAAEQDRTRVGFASPRLRLAINAAERLRIKAAVPYLVALYDVPTAGVQTKNTALLAAIKIDPGYSTELLRDILADDSLAMDGYEHAPHFMAAAALLKFEDDDDARALLVEGYRGFLDSLPTRAAEATVARQGRVNGGVLEPLLSTADPKLAELLAQLSRENATEFQRRHIAVLVWQMKSNMLPIEELFTIAEQTPPVEGPDDKVMGVKLARRMRAFVALSRMGGPDLLPRMQAIEKRIADEVLKDPATTQPSVDQEIDRLPASPAGRRAQQLGALRDSIRVLCLRHAIAPPKWEETEPTTQPSTRPVTFAAVDPAFATRAEARRVTGLGTFGAVGQTSGFVELVSVSGQQPPERLSVKGKEMVDLMRGLPPETVVLITRGDGGKSIDQLKPIDVAPGETAPDGYVFVETRRVKSGEWEHLAAVLHKYGREIVARVPNRTRPDGTSVGETRLAGQLQRFKAGDVVSARFDSLAGLLMLSLIEPYEPSLQAQYVKFTRTAAGAPAVELNVARKSRVLELPSDEDRPHMLDADMRRSLVEGFDVRFIPGAKPDGPIRDLWIDGYLNRSADGTFVARSGRTVFQVSGKPEQRNTTISLNAADTETTRVVNGMAKIVARPDMAPPNFRQEKIQFIRDMIQNQIQPSPYTEEEKQTCVELVDARDAATDPAERRHGEQELYLVLQQISERLEKLERGRVERMRGELTPTEFQGLVDLGRTAPKPKVRPKKRMIVEIRQ